MENEQLLRLPAAELRRAADVKEKIEKLQGELSVLLKVAPSMTLSKSAGVMSAAGRARIAAAQKARWAKWKRGSANSEQRKVHRKMSASARKRLAEIAKARWAKAKAQGKSKL